MDEPLEPRNEAGRQRSVRHLGLLDTEPEERFDRYTRLASRLFGVETALLTLIDADRVWWKSRVGVTDAGMPRALSLCGHAILDDDLLVLEDAAADPRFHDNPSVVDGLRFYAGCPLAGVDGHVLGTLCIMDRQPRSFSEQDREALRDIGAMAAGELAALQVSITDELTGISNARGFEVLAAQSLAVARRAEQTASVVMIDLDGLAEINATLGPRQGDRALRAFSRVLVETLRNSDVVARLAGDHFCVLLTGADSGRAEMGLGRLETSTAELNRSGRLPFRLAYSTGIAECLPGTRLQEAMVSADARLLANKVDRTVAQRATA